METVQPLKIVLELMTSMPQPPVAFPAHHRKGNKKPDVYQPQVLLCRFSFPFLLIYFLVSMNALLACI